MRLADRSRLTALLGGLAVAFVALTAAVPARKPGEMLVYKSPSCGCCKKWVEQMRQQGYGPGMGRAGMAPGLAPQSPDAQ